MFVILSSENSLKIGTFFNIKILLENKQFDGVIMNMLFFIPLEKKHAEVPYCFS